MARPKAMRACAPLLTIALLLATLCDARSTPYRPPTGPYRGGAAANMLEEFAAYGLPAWSCYLVGFLKVASAFALLAGLLYPAVVLPAAIIIAVLMAGAVAMHLKVGDPFMKSLPALSVLILSGIIAYGHWPA